MFGGTAKTFKDWEMLGEPFQSNKVYYIMARNPLTKREKRVRWYKKKENNDWMPNKMKMSNEPWRIFGLNSNEEKLTVIKDSLLSEDERKTYFSYKWRMVGFLGGMWYQHSEKSLPPIKNSADYAQLSWEEFRKLGYDYAIEQGMILSEDSHWLSTNV